MLRKGNGGSAKLLSISENSSSGSIVDPGQQTPEVGSVNLFSAALSLKY